MLFSVSILSGHSPRLTLSETAIHLNFILTHQGEGYQLPGWGGGKVPPETLLPTVYIYIFFDCTASYVGSYFLSSNPHLLHWKYSLNHWTTREVLIHILFKKNHPHFYTFGNAKEFFVDNIFLESMFHLPLTLVMKLNFNCMKI